MRRLVPSALIAALALGAPAHAQPANGLPPGDGREIMTAVCTQCHALTVIISMRAGPVVMKRTNYTYI